MFSKYIEHLASTLHLSTQLSEHVQIVQSPFSYSLVEHSLNPTSDVHEPRSSLRIKTPCHRQVMRLAYFRFHSIDERTIKFTPGQ